MDADLDARGRLTFRYEKDFAQSLVDDAVRLDWGVWRTHNSKSSPAGWPDLVMIHEGAGISIFAELKLDQRRRKKAERELSPAQRRTLVALWRAGHRVFVWTPSYAHQFMAVLLLQYEHRV